MTTPNIEQQALELLAAEYERDGMRAIAADIRMRGAITHQENIVCRAIVHALRDSGFCHQCEQDRPHWLELEKLLRHNPFGFTGSYAEIVAKLIHALTPTGENAKHVEVLRVMLNGDASRLNLQAYEREAIDAAIRALSAPDNDGVVIRDYIVLRPDGIQYRTDASGAAMATKREGFRVYAEIANIPKPAARGSVSDEDLVLAEEAASYLHDHASLKKMNATRWAAAIRRLVQAVKGEK